MGLGMTDALPRSVITLSVAGALPDQPARCRREPGRSQDVASHDETKRGRDTTRGRASSDQSRNSMATTQKDTLITWLRDAHAMENHTIELLERQAGRLGEYPDFQRRVREHLEEDGRVLVTSEANVADLPLALRAIERLDDTAAREVLVRLRGVDALVDLPEIEVVRPQALQRLVQLAHRDRGVAPVRADLRHEKYTFATIADRATQSFLALPLVVLPRVVHESDAGVDGGMNDLHGFARGLDQAEVIAAEPERRDGLVRVASKGT